MTMIRANRFNIGVTRKAREKSPARESPVASVPPGTSRVSGIKGKVVKTRSVTAKMPRTWRRKSTEDVVEDAYEPYEPDLPVRQICLEEDLAYAKCTPLETIKSMGSDGGNKAKRTAKSDAGSSSSSNTPTTRNEKRKPIVDRVPSDDEARRLGCSQHAFPFHRACGLKAQPELLVELLQLHPSVARKYDDEGTLPIHRLVTDCGSAFIPVLVELIRRCPQGVDQEDAEGQLPIHRVCRSKKKMSIEVVKVLVEASPSCLTRRVDGLLPLHMLCLNARSEPRVVELVANQAPMAAAAATTSEKQGKFPLHIACNVKSKHMSVIVAILMSVAPEVAAIPCGNDEYPLHVATAAGNTATIAAILQLYPQAARICDSHGSLPVNVAYLRWHFSSLTGAEGVADTLDPLMVLLEAYPQGLYHVCSNGERIIDSLCKKSDARLDMLLSAAYPVTSPPSIRVEDSLPKDLDNAQFHLIPSKAVQALKRIHPASVHVAREGEAYVIG